MGVRQVRRPARDGKRGRCGTRPAAGDTRCREPLQGRLADAAGSQLMKAMRRVRAKRGAAWGAPSVGFWCSPAGAVRAGRAGVDGSCAEPGYSLEQVGFGVVGELVRASDGEVGSDGDIDLRS